VATAATGVGSTSFTANWNAFVGASYYLLDVSTSSSFSSFVGSYQNFVVLSTSQLVSGLTASTTYYYRLRAATGVDADAAAFFSRVYTAGGALTYTEVTATETLVSSMKADGTWTPMKAIYPMIGASAAACAQNLKSSSFTGTFSSGWNFASTGVTGNGFSTYFDTTLTPLTSLSLNNTSGSYYIANDYNFEAKDIICTGQGSYLGIYTTATLEVAVNDNFTSAITPTIKKGLFTFSRIISTESKTYANNLQTFTNSKTSSFLTNFAIRIGCLYENGNNSRFTSNSIRFAHLGDGLTDTQASNFYTAVQAFQTTLVRQV
jgi:hypothetical protein